MLDEPTANLDPEAAADFYEMFCSSATSRSNSANPLLSFRYVLLLLVALGEHLIEICRSFGIEVRGRFIQHQKPGRRGHAGENESLSLPARKDSRVLFLYLGQPESCEGGPRTSIDSLGIK